MLSIPMVINPEELDALIEGGHLDKEYSFGVRGAKLAGVPHYFNSVQYKDGKLQFYKDVSHLGITLTRDELGYCKSKIETDVVEYRSAEAPLVLCDAPNEVNGYSELEILGGALRWDCMNVLNLSGCPFEQPVIVIDIETLSTNANAAVIQISAVFGDLVSGKISSFFNEHINRTCSINSKRKVDLDTILWHVAEREKDHTFHKQMPLATYDQKQFWGLDQAIKRLEGFIQSTESLIRLSNGKEAGKRISPLRILCKGPEFDLKVLEDVYKQMGRPIPWNYKNVGSVRTYEHLYVDMRIRQGVNCDDAEREIRDFLKGRSLITHDGLFDALTEFELVYEICTLLGTNKPVLE